MVPGREGTSMTYRVHRFDIRMSRDAGGLERFLNGLTGEIVAIIPNLAWGPFWIHRVDFLLVVERTA